MTRIHFPAIAVLCAASLFGAMPPAAWAVDAATGRVPTSPDQPKPRIGNYKVVKHGAKVTRARCAEGGNVMVPSREKAAATRRDRDIHEACKTVDYTK